MKKIFLAMTHFIFRIRSFNNNCIKILAHRIKEQKILEWGSGLKKKVVIFTWQKNAAAEKILYLIECPEVREKMGKREKDDRREVYLGKNRKEHDRNI